MTPPPIHYGVDFSGAVDAGRKIWIAAITAENDRLRVIDCRQALELPGGAVGREGAIAALRHFITRQSDTDESGTRFGLDFPFSLHRSLIRHPTWEPFARQFADDFPTAQALYEAGQAARIALGSPLQRRTDVEARTPFPPHNLRLFRQTYYGIRDLLAPLIADDAARVLPMQPAAAGKPSLIEICPAVTLKRLGLYVSYKGKTPAHAANRERLVTAFETLGLVISPPVRTLLLSDPEGDALDSVIAAFATARIPPQILITDDPVYQLEGMVYG